MKGLDHVIRIRILIGIKYEIIITSGPARVKVNCPYLEKGDEKVAASLGSLGIVYSLGSSDARPAWVSHKVSYMS